MQKVITWASNNQVQSGIYASRPYILAGESESFLLVSIVVASRTGVCRNVLNNKNDKNVDTHMIHDFHLRFWPRRFLTLYKERGTCQL